MNNFFDSFTLVLAIIAVGVIYRLWTVLGRKEDNSYLNDLYSKPTKDKPSIAQTKFSSTKEDMQQDILLETDDSISDMERDAPNWEKFNISDKNIKDNIDKIYKISSTFKLDSFVEGSKLAYETILTAFANGNLKTLKTLCSNSVFKTFKNSIEKREQDKLSQDFSFIGIEKLEFIDTTISDNDKVTISLKFVAQCISATKDENDDVVSGSSNLVQNQSSICTFEKILNDEDPTWVMVAIKNVQ